MPASEIPEPAPQPSPDPSPPESSTTAPATSVTVAVTGATGFVGRHLLRTLVAAGHRLRALVRVPGRKGVLPAGCEETVGDIHDRKALDALVAGADACIHLVGIIFENRRKNITFEHLHVDGTRAIVAACQAAGVERYVHMSALGARPDAKAVYHRTKFQAEQIVRDSGLRWTIFRPSLIHGPQGEFTEMVAGWCRGRKPPFVFLPYFGRGATGFGVPSVVQPVYVQDVAAALCRALTTDRAIRETYALGGADQMTWARMLTAFREAIPGTAPWRRPFPIPAWYAYRLAQTSAWVGLAKLVPFNCDQVVMSREDQVCDLTRVREHLGVNPLSLAEALSQYAHRL